MVNSDDKHPVTEVGCTDVPLPVQSIFNPRTETVPHVLIKCSLTCSQNKRNTPLKSKSVNKWGKAIITGMCLVATRWYAFMWNMMEISAEEKPTSVYASLKPPGSRGLKIDLLMN